MHKFWTSENTAFFKPDRAPKRITHTITCPCVRFRSLNEIRQFHYCSDYVTKSCFMNIKTARSKLPQFAYPLFISYLQTAILCSKQRSRQSHHVYLTLHQMCDAISPLIPVCA